MKQSLRVLMAQINTAVGDLSGNSARALKTLESARRQKADLVIFPELTLTGYPPEDLLLKKHFVSQNLQELKKIVASTRGLKVVLGFVDRDKKGALYNAAAFISSGQIISIYRKTRLPNYGVFDEKRYFSENPNQAVIEVGGVRFGLTICEDIWQKDAYVYQRSYRNSVDFLINISASPYHLGKQKQREALLKNLAAKTQAVVLYQNLVGGQDELVFDGGSMVTGPDGKIHGSAKRFEEDELIINIAFGKKIPSIESLKAAPLGHEEEVYKALLLGTSDYIRKNGFKKVLVGLSGGIDSALVARIAVDVLGPQNVIGVTMPSIYTSDETYLDAKKLAQNLKVECLEIPIHKIFQSYLETLKSIWGEDGPKTAEENIQARIRGNILMALSNQWGCLVLTTGNKSEMATGYCTLYGDMAGGFAVIKDIPKTLVFRLAAYRNKLSPEGSIPESVLKRPPTAELRPNQKDQDTLPPYPLLDRFLSFYIEQDLSVEEIVRRGIPKLLAKKMARMVDLNEYKRRQAPPGVKITPKAFGRDRRMPITNRYFS
jgi:NAD+ synthase (glutamine-hydrolysing)